MTQQGRSKSKVDRRRGMQAALPFRVRGGARPGAGRKPKGDRPEVPHARRPALASRFPVHVTVKVCAGLPSLRRRAEQIALRAVFRAAADRFGFRLVHYSVQTNHLHLIAEAGERTALTRGMKGLLVRAARALNRLWRRRGPLVRERFHEHVLRTPREVRNALAYVLGNARRHGIAVAGIDPCSSGVKPRLTQPGQYATFTGSGSSLQAAGCPRRPPA